MTETAPSWAKGFDLDLLREIAAPFADAFKPYVNGAFGLPKENAVADALASEECIYTRAGRNQVQGAALAKRLKSASRQVDFAGRAYTPQAGDIMVRAIAGTDEARLRIIESIEGQGAPSIWIEDFVEAPHSALWADLGYQLAGTKIMASSDIKGLWIKGKIAGRLAPALDPSDMPALSTLSAMWLAPDLISQALGEIAAYEARIGAEPWAQHYSNYNKRQSWTAFALRGFDPADPGFIIKPTEMSRAWIKENPGRMAATCHDTIAYPAFPIIRSIVEQLPGKPQRVRLMRLAGGNGELSRHADIVDPEAGTANGKTSRLHIPLQSPPQCRFIGWELDGRRIERRFAPGSLCYLDTRKPHMVINPGEADRIHLVVDQFATPDLRAMIAAGRH